MMITTLLQGAHSSHHRLSVARTRCLVLFVLAITGCGAGERTGGVHVERTDSAGIEIVTTEGADRTLELSLERLFTLGGEEEGPESFYFLPVGAVGSDGEGRIYVLDLTDRRVVVFGPAGGVIRTMGGEGGGPGEFAEPNGIAVSAEGEVSVFDFGKGGLVRFAGDGTVLPEQPLQEFPTWSEQRHFDVVGSGYAVSSIADSPGAGDRTHQLRVIDAGGSAAVSLAELEPVRPRRVLSERCGGGISRAPIFSSDIIWDARGDRVALNAEPGYSIAVTDETGRITRIVRRPLTSPAATRDLALAEVDEGFTIDFGRGPCTITAQELVEGLGFADAVPLVRNVRLASDGGLWVERRAGDDVTRSRIDVFDPAGEYVGTLPSGTPFPVLLLPDDRVAVVEKDEFDVERLVVMRVEVR